MLELNKLYNMDCMQGMKSFRTASSILRSLIRLTVSA